MAYITLNKNNFFNNLDIIANITKDKDKIALVLKDNAYGHGIIEISSMAKEYGITKAVVRTNDEAKKIDEYFEYILVLADIPTQANDKVRYTINDIKKIQDFPKGTKVELKVDTLMHRNGVSISEVADAIGLIDKQGLILEAVFTHHRSADALTSEWFTQNENFTKVKKIVKDLGLNNIRFHSDNSASIMRRDVLEEDMVRVGIAAYGCLDSDAIDTSALKPVLFLIASRNSSRNILKGQKVGYGGTYTALQDEVLSNYDFGYADGFLRSLSNNYKTPSNVELVGRISMDNSSFLSDEDELLIFDDARLIAKSAGSIPYEILTSLKENILRVLS